MARKPREAETAVIVAVTHDGRGIADVPGKKVFVAGALTGETVRFQRRKRRRNYDEAELVDVITASTDRVTPRCPVFGACGGCSLQHVSAADQRRIKHQSLVDNLERIGRVAPRTWYEPLFDDSPDGGWHYRRRARLAVKDVAAKGRVLVGFREAHAPFVCDMHHCDILAQPVAELLDPLSELIGRLSIRSRLPQIEVAVADNAAALVFRVLDPPTDGDRVALNAFGRDYGVEILLQSAGPDSVRPIDPAVPAAPLRYRLADHDVDIEFGAIDFVQINGAVNRLMVARALDLLDVRAGHHVLDLFCGIGNFSLPLARRAAAVLGVEGDAHQVDRARRNAASNGIDNCRFLQADLATIDGSEDWLRQGWQRLLLDPARAGAREVVAQVEVTGASRIVYVSCHPGSLARDAAILVHDKGYALEGAGIIDMFPHTGHVESLAVFQKD